MNILHVVYNLFDSSPSVYDGGGVGAVACNSIAFSFAFVNVVLGNIVNGNCSFVFVVVRCRCFLTSATESYDGGKSSKIYGLC